MSLYADICRSYPGAGNEDVVFDPGTKTWTVLAVWGADAIPGIPDKEMALAIARALCAAYKEGGYQAGFS